MRRTSVLVTGVLALAAICAGARAEQASVLLEAGVYAEEVVGDLDRAIETYRKIIADAEVNRPCVAEAHYRLGKCYLARGDDAKARAQFAQVAERYPDQSKLAEAAQCELAKLQPPAPPSGEVRRVLVPDMEVDGRGLDLDTGELVSVPVMKEGGPGQFMAVLADLGIDMFYEGSLILVEGTSAEREKLELEGGYTAHILSPHAPTNIVTTREGGRFELIILDSGRGGCHIEFRRLAPASGELTFGPVVERVVSENPGPGEEGTGRDWLLDLDTGQLYGPDEGRTVRWLQSLGIDAAGVRASAGVLTLLNCDAAILADVTWETVVPRHVTEALEDPDALMRPDDVESGVRVTEIGGETGPDSNLYAFRTAPGGSGVLQILAVLNRGGVRIRYKMVQELPAPPADELTFGPVIDRVVNDDGEPVNMLIDLDTGNLFSASDFSGIRDRHGVVAAMRRMGIDAGGETAAALRGLGLVDTVSVSVGAEGWDASAEEVARELQGRLPATTEPGEGGISAAGGVPATFFFRTREGGMGILQILELRDQAPRGVRIRYKMVQSGGAEQITRPSPPAPVLSKPYLAAGTEVELALGAGTALDLETGSLVDVPPDVAGSPGLGAWLNQAEADLAWCPPASLLAAQMRTRDRLLGQGAGGAGRPPADSIKEALSERVPAQFAHTPIPDVADFVNQVTEAQIVLLPGVPALDPPIVTVTIEAPFAEVLDHVVRAANLAWKADGTLIWLGSPEEVSAFAVVRGIDVQPADHVTEALNERAPAQFRDTPLGDVVDFLQQTTPVDVLLLPDARHSTAPVSLYVDATLAEVLDAICRQTRMAWRVDRSAINIGTPRELGLLEDGVLESVTGIELAAMPMPPGSDYENVRAQLDSVDNRPGVALVQGQRLPVKYLLRTEGGAVCSVELFAAELTTAGPRLHLRYRYIEGVAPTPSAVGEASRLSDLQMRLADAKAELSASEATVKYWQREIERTEPLARAGRADPTEVERARLELSRARAAQGAARQKAEILTAEIARLEAGPQAAPSPSDAARLTDLRIRLAEARAELFMKEEETEAARMALRRAEAGLETGVTGPDKVEQSRLDFSRAQVELGAAHEKVDILTREIARLEASVTGPAGPSPGTERRREAARGQNRQAILEAMYAVGVAMEMYKADHNGTFPPDPGELEKGGYLPKEDSPFRRWPELRWRYVIPQTRNAGAVVLYHWPPVDGQVTLLHLDGAAQSVTVDEDGVLRNPRTGETITTGADSP